MSATVTEQTKILVELQKIDSEIFRLKKELDAQPETQKRLDSDFEKKKAGLKAAEEAVKQEQLKQKQKEGDLASREEKITKLQAQLYQLKSNKEYSAMELEIKGLKADKSLLEEDILRLLDSVDQAKAAAAKEKEMLGTEEKAYRTETDALKKRAGELQQEIASHEEKRKAYTPNIDKRLLSQYERILKNRDGLAIVPVVNNACGGCHLGLPPQVVNETQLHDKWIVCESCARLIYWPN